MNDSEHAKVTKLVIKKMVYFFAETFRMRRIYLNIPSRLNKKSKRYNDSEPPNKQKV